MIPGKKWLKAFFYNFNCFIIKHNLYVILFECIRIFSSLSLEDIKLVAMVNWIFHVWAFLRTFIITFKYGLIVFLFFNLKRFFISWIISFFKLKRFLTSLIMLCYFFLYFFLTLFIIAPYEKKYFIFFKNIWVFCNPFKKNLIILSLEYFRRFYIIQRLRLYELCKSQ